MTTHEDPETGEVFGENSRARQTAIQLDPGRQLQISNEAAAFAMAEKERASIQARHAVARARPRDLAIVREKLLERCRSPRFADGAMYSRPVGNEKDKVTGEWRQKYAEGLSIRFVETAMQAMGNCSVEMSTISDSEVVRTIQVKAIDFESNMDWSDQVSLQKTVEKRSPPKGRSVIGKRVNSQGEMTYLVAATEDEFAVRVAAQKSKTARVVAERLIPIDLREDCRAVIEATLLAEEKRDPDGRRAKLIAAWAGIGVALPDLEAFLGRPLEQATVKMVRELNGMWNAIRDGETTWADALAASPFVAPRPAVAETGGAPTSITEAAKRAAAKAKGKPAEAPVAQAAQPVSDPAVTAAKAAVKPAEPGKKPTREPGEDNE